MALIEGLMLTRPRPALRTVHGRVVTVAAERGWVLPSYASIRAVSRTG